MEGASVKDRIHSLEDSRSTSRSTQTSPIRPPLTPATKERSFAEAGARLSFQKRVDTNLRLANSENFVPRVSPSPSPQARSRNGHVNSDPALKVTTSPPKITRISSGHSSTVISGALQAAAIAAQRQNSSPPKSTPTSSPSKSEISGKKPEFQRAPASVGSTAGDFLAAAKASVNKPTAPTPPLRNKVPSANLAAKASVNIDHIVLPVTPDKRGTVAASTAVLQSRAKQAAISVANTPSTSPQPSTLAAVSVSNKPPLITKLPSPSPSPQPSTIAAASVANKSPLPSPPILPTERETKFGVILSRAVSPAPSERIERSLSSKRKQFYQLPDATASEPTLSTNFTDPTHRSHRPSPLGPPRPIISNRESSSGSSSSLADVGAATAMGSRNISVTSLPTLRAADDIELMHNIPSSSRRRPTHLKTTMRKERRHEKEKTKSHHVATAITEAERKRYEGVWASNHRHTFFSDPESAFIDNLVVRELWMRSNLSFDELGHIWDLVDQNLKGKLTREEFVVGMWLIDQTLSGRKLPNTSISPEVWRSAQRLATFTKHH